MNPCDSFYWGYLNPQVFNKPLSVTLDELKVKVKRKFEDITAEMIRKAVYEMKNRAGRVVMEDEMAFEGKTIRF